MQSYLPSLTLHLLSELCAYLCRKKGGDWSSKLVIKFLTLWGNCLLRRVCFPDRGLLLTRKLLNKGFFLVKLKTSLRKLYGRYHDLVDRYYLSLGLFCCRKVSFLSAPQCQFRCVGQAMMQSYLWYIFLQAQWDRCDQRNRQA
jgi:hypothetical protein